MSSNIDSKNNSLAKKYLDLAAAQGNHQAQHLLDHLPLIKTEGRSIQHSRMSICRGDDPAAKALEMCRSINIAEEDLAEHVTRLAPQIAEQIRKIPDEQEIDWQNLKDVAMTMCTQRRVPIHLIDKVMPILTQQVFEARRNFPNDDEYTQEVLRIFRRLKQWPEPEDDWLPSNCSGENKKAESSSGNQGEKKKKKKGARKKK